MLGQNRDHHADLLEFEPAVRHVGKAFPLGRRELGERNRLLGKHRVQVAHGRRLLQMAKQQVLVLVLGRHG